MKRLLVNIGFLFTLALYASYTFAQSAQPQNTNQNATPANYGTPSTPQGTPTIPNNSTAPSKPVDGAYGNPNPAPTGPSGPLLAPRINSGATGATGGNDPQRFNGSEHQRSPQ